MEQGERERGEREREGKREGEGEREGDTVVPTYIHEGLYIGDVLLHEFLQHQSINLECILQEKRQRKW